ncbi:MAG: polyketide synthase dehydratase domain-containing protein [Deltaproteobacteria bacterium]|nr:polyketide synthase dehydratase domain-containing protein [Deltaproteobacteria bacterium]
MRSIIRIENHPYLFDHSVEGRAVYPAVESLERLAEAVTSGCPGRKVMNSCDAEFLRFLVLPAEKSSAEVVADIETKENGEVTASIGTFVRAPGVSISRIREHARVTFSDIPPPVPIPLDIACAGEGLCYAVTAERLYKEMVKFGASFHNAVGTVFLFHDGAVATLQAPVIGIPNPPLGSPFVLDAAFHVASAWGQRYRGYIAFPVGYAVRTIIHPAIAGESYFCRVIPMADEADTLVFDIWIYDKNGELCEAVSGVRMKDVFKNKIQVPEWVIDIGTDKLRVIKERSMGMSVVELASILPFAENILSPHELEIVRRRHPGKRNMHIGARIALKRLSRILYRTGVPDDPSLIETIAPDGIHPACVPSGNKQGFYCSASHDDRFAVAVGGNHPIGVDVERIKDTLLKGTHVYMTSSEQALCARSPLGQKHAAIRVWTTKECAAKALDIPIAAMWFRAELKEIKEDRSIVSIEGKAVEAAHTAVDDHLFTVLQIPGA